MAAIKFGETCPCYTWVCCDKFHCDSCSHLDGYFVNDEGNEIVGCKYSEIPSFESPFKVGDMVWYLDMGQFPRHGKVRKIKWEGSYYTYCCDRKQHSCKVYNTKEECCNDLAKSMCESGIAKIKNAIQYAGGLENLKKLLNNDNVKLLVNIEQLN